MTGHPALLLLALLAVGEGAGYYGKFLGPLSSYHHGVSGDVYIVDARTIHIRDFTYDGEGPAAYFYVGNTKTPGPNGIRVRDETGSSGVLKRYNKKHITLTLPEGKTLSAMKWFSVWCDEFSVNFGDIKFPRYMEIPKPQKIGALNGVHAVSSDNIVVVDAQTLLVPSFSYDGEAPDAKFWVGTGSKPTPQGTRVPDENGKTKPLRLYQRKTIVLTLPGDLTIYDIDYFGIWCEAFTVDFGHVKIPKGLDVPPSLKMLGVSPQKRSLQLNAQQGDYQTSPRPDLDHRADDVRPTTYRPVIQRQYQPVQFQPLPHLAAPQNIPFQGFQNYYSPFQQPIPQFQNYQDLQSLQPVVQAPNYIQNQDQRKGTPAPLVNQGQNNQQGTQVPFVQDVYQGQNPQGTPAPFVQDIYQGQRISQGTAAPFVQDIYHNQRNPQGTPAPFIQDIYQRNQGTQIPFIQNIYQDQRDPRFQRFQNYPGQINQQYQDIQQVQNVYRDQRERVPYQAQPTATPAPNQQQQSQPKKQEPQKQQDGQKPLDYQRPQDVRPQEVRPQVPVQNYPGQVFQLPYQFLQRPYYPDYQSPRLPQDDSVQIVPSISLNPDGHYQQRPVGLLDQGRFGGQPAYQQNYIDRRSLQQPYFRY